ncbi:MAG: TIGR03746 family integrating conjugative element protein [Pseudomonadales bacterium]|nr:TIGR03746 family integrating conjugative element protein [Pseudomonadales bacterium]
MRRYRLEIDNVRAHIRSLRVLAVLLLGLALALVIGLMRAPEHLTVHIPPDLRSGASLARDEVGDANVYAFAYYIFQQLNHWPNDGARDYGSAIFSLAAYLTPEYRASLISDVELKGKQGELAHRARRVQQRAGRSYEEARVDIMDDESWVVWLDLQLFESVQGMTVKETLIRYPIRVVRYAVDPESNPWGLALDGFHEPGPFRIDHVETADATTRGKGGD